MAGDLQNDLLFRERLREIARRNKRSKRMTAKADSVKGKPVNFFGLPKSKLEGVLVASGVDSTEAKKLSDEALGEKPKPTLLDKIINIVRKAYKFRSPAAAAGLPSANLGPAILKGAAPGRSDIDAIREVMAKLREIKKSLLG